MSEKEKQILEAVKKAVPKMSEFDKGYLLGFSESRVSEKEAKERERKNDGADR